MTDELIIRRDNLHKSTSYGGNENFHSASTWQSQKWGHILVDDSTNENAVLAVVGQILENGLQCSASGNFHRRNYETLQKAKYQVMLGKPKKTVFADDFDLTIKKLAAFQADIASYPTRENFIVLDGRQKTLRFTHDIFEKRARSDQGAFYL